MLLAVEGVSKRFPGVLALQDVKLAVRPGEAHALLGENGAGKSTLLKILAGAQPADDGRIVFGGEVLDPQDDPRRRQGLGIVTIYQEFNLAPNLTVEENIFLGREPVRRGLVDWKRLRSQSQAVLARLGVDVDPAARTQGLSIAQQQMVEIARALTLDARLIVMDEPTATLSLREVERLHQIVRDLKATGVSVLYVTHRLAEVKAICDTFTVLRDGRDVARGAVADVEISDLVRAMVGRDVTRTSARGKTPGPEVLSFELNAKSAPPVSLALHTGEIVGLAGLVGAGRTEFARRLFGADRCEGAIWLDGKRRAPFSSPTDAMRHGLAMTSEDRKAQGCFLPHAVLWNISLPSLPRLGKAGFISGRMERSLANRFVQRLNIRTPSLATPIGSLSGGNQQKALLARNVSLNPRVLIVDEPTRGVDIGAKAEVHRILFDLADSGIAILAISSDLPELLEISDRIAVMREGSIVGEFRASEATEEGLMFSMTGQKEATA